ncbi:DUF1934 domain-containing protein [Scatolibacter rhodanostii]|uniref:DUF1934 domain-containing protein n=1 Tax=Scatolibacter rhodanostii TaxID=2014781 RepID=UPI000C0696C0|nr:DUF1934 domain-containing protein [Scatolibacter rhodanostii]
MNKEDFDIYVVGSQKFSEGDDTQEVQTVGQYYQKDGKRYIGYREYDEENPNDFHSVLIEIDGEKAVMNHENTSTSLILEKGKRYLCAYETDYGMIQLGVFTRSFSSTLDDNGGELQIHYTLDIDSKLSSTNEIKIRVKRR